MLTSCNTLATDWFDVKPQPTTCNKIYSKIMTKDPTLKQLGTGGDKLFCSFKRKVKFGQFFKGEKFKDMSFDVKKFLR
jgi:hypothetical protein